MPRPFSSKGGPYFINNGLSRHDHDHKPGSSHEHNKPDVALFYTVLIGFGIVITVIVSVLNALH
jgi:hypothetical protein